MYILILVDDKRPIPSVKSEDTYIQYIQKGQQMVGLRFGGERPSLIIDCIQKRTLGVNLEFDKWWDNCVLPVGARIVKGREWI